MYWGDYGRSIEVEGEIEVQGIRVPGRRELSWTMVYRWWSARMKDRIRL
jgi:hypothetical protein